MAASRATQSRTTRSPSRAARRATSRSRSRSTAPQPTEVEPRGDGSAHGSRRLALWWRCAMPAEILVGTCNWADHQQFYPPELEKGQRQRDKLTYYARFFPIVEIDTTFYGIPKPQVVEGWLGRTPPGFRFNVKAYRALTRHERENGVPRDPTTEEIDDFLVALQPLRESGRLVAVHYQFPPWLTNTPGARDVVAEARERHPDDIVAVEFRHRSWFDGDAWPQTQDLLRELDAVYVGVDAPQVGSATAPPLLAVTSPKLCIARFHGRNRQTWYVKN